MSKQTFENNSHWGRWSDIKNFLSKQLNRSFDMTDIGNIEYDLVSENETTGIYETTLFLSDGYEDKEFTFKYVADVDTETATVIYIEY